MAKNIVNPSILPGFMELLPNEQIAFDKMLETIKKSYELYGFTPVDTPIIEKSEVLLAKSGGETEKQIYSFTKGDNDLSLRFDLTVPLARYVAQYQNDLTFPFKRYQIGKVYRGEKPQKGRYREFYQCDIDVIDRDTLSFVNDAEILATIFNTFKNLDIADFVIEINNRKIILGFLDFLRIVNKDEVLRIIDKLEKIGKNNFVKTLEDIEVSKDQIENILEFLSIEGTSIEVLEKLQELGINEYVFQEGLKELTEVATYVKYMKIPETNWKINLKIARGLDYYTGTVYETFLKKYRDLGSICSGGRYDNLAEFYTNQKLPGVGVSIGLTRLFFLLNEAKLVEKVSSKPIKILLIPFENTLKETFEIATNLRNENVSTEVYADYSKGLKKMFKFANEIGVPFVGVVGDDEIKNKALTLKNMSSGEQKAVSLKNIFKTIS